MSDESKSWYNKYRPYNIDGYSGPKIKKMIQGRFRVRAEAPRVILAHGTRGCGKTTICRILTKYFQCTNPNEDGSPCEKCEACRDINENVIYGAEEGIQVDGIREVPANVVNGKEALQEIINTAKIEPMYSNYNILILDEFHEASKSAQESLLKDFEDLKPYMVVMIATTNPEKLLDAIKSRCLFKIEVRRQSVHDMADRLEEIAIAEKLHATRPALENIAKKTECVPRESITLLENIAKTYNKQVNNENLIDYLDEISTDYYIKFFNAANDSLEELLYLITELKEKDVKIRDYIEGLMQFVLDALYIKNGVNLDNYNTSLIKEISKLFEHYQINEFDMLIQIMQDALTKASSNDISNETLLITTGLRITKLGLLSKGLASFSEEAVVENKTSLAEHAKMLSRENKKVSEQAKFNITPAFAQESFEGASLVDTDASSINYLQHLSNVQDIEEALSDNKLDEEYSGTNLKDSEEEIRIMNEIDDFFSK